jgi:undecaprenyl-diphosphatase
MQILQDFFLGIIQGLTVVFPISSSGHLIVYGRILDRELSFSSILLLKIGTLFAVVYYYRKDILRLVFGYEGRALVGRLLVCLAATGALGYILEDRFVGALTSRPDQVALLLVVNGVLIAFLGVFARPGTRTMSELNIREYLFIGAIQGLAGLPGLSRLGLTLGAGLLRKMSWAEALTLSFLLSIPTILAANILVFVKSFLAQPISWSLPEWSTLSLDPAFLLAKLMPVVVAFVCGLAGLQILYRVLFLGRRLLLHFGIYCVCTGLFFVLYLRLF